MRLLSADRQVNQLSNPTISHFVPLANIVRHSIKNSSELLTLSLFISPIKRVINKVIHRKFTTIREGCNFQQSEKTQATD